MAAAAMLLWKRISVCTAVVMIVIPAKVEMNMKRQKCSADHWSKVRNQMLHAAVECGIPSSLSTCILCKEPADVTCLECGFQAVYHTVR